MDITDWGLFAANPAARVDGAARFLKCDCDSPKGCQDLGTQALAGSVTVTGIIYEGVTYNFDGILVTATQDIAAAINAIIEQFEVEPIILVNYGGGALTVEHWGAGALTSVITSGTNVTMVRECVTEIVCTYGFSVSETFTFNGESITISGASTATTIKTAIEAEIDGEAGYKSVVVTEEPAGTFNVIVYAVRGTVTTVNGNEIAQGTCMKGWLTADFVIV